MRHLSGGHSPATQVTFTWIPVLAEVLEVFVRRTDANNCWIVRCNQAGGAIKLIEKVAGVETERSSAGQAWTVATPYALEIACTGATIETRVDSTLKNSYASALFNQDVRGVTASSLINLSGLVVA